MGFMLQDLDPYSAAFVAFSASCKNPVLDIGAAYGSASLKALAAGASVFANDMDSRHLEKLAGSASSEQRTRLQFLPGRVPDCLDLGQNSVGAALCSRVLHFLDLADLQQTVDLLYHSLVPGGRLFIAEDSPFLGNSRAFIPEYRRRCLEGLEWPGYVEDVRKYRDIHNDMCPPIFHFFDVESLSYLCQQAGFTIVESSLFPRHNYPDEVRLDGREGVGIVAAKLIQQDKGRGSCKLDVTLKTSAWMH